MRKIYLFFLSVILWSAASPAFGQRNLVHVNQYNGTANVIIPIYTIENGALSVGINLVNSGGGVRVKDVEGDAGIGWQLSGSGKISREIRNLPDDCKADNANNPRLGWIYNTNGTRIDNFVIANDGSSATCTDETTDISALNTNFSDLSDTEPDLFSINAPGLSCSFVFDKNHNIQTIPYQDVKITYTTNATTGELEIFNVVNDQGVNYRFNALYASRSFKQAVTTTGTYPNAQTVSESNIAYFKTQFLQYKNGINSYNTWYLESITDANHNTINFSYGAGLSQNNITPVELYIGSTTKTIQYWINEQSSPQLLSFIRQGDNGKYAHFTYSNNYYTSQSLLSTISLSGGVTYLLNYSSVFPLSGRYTRYFLRDVTTDQCNSPAKYQFKYAGETYTDYQYKTALGDSSSKNIDYWGYATNYSNTNLLPAVNINPSNTALQRYQITADNLSRSAYSITLSGANRRTDATVVAAGSVSQITYLDNGSTTLTYEPNDYYDPTAGAVVQGGGVRIKQITDYDGISTAHNMVSNYTYLNPSTGLSSGKPASLPVYAFTRPYTGSGSTQDLWNNATVRSDLDLSSADHSVVYSHAKESKTGSGSLLHEYYTPATNYDASAAPSCFECSTTDWTPTKTYIARTGCATAGFMANDKITYPFAPNINYDFERGLIKSIKAYNETGDLVKESTYSYQRTGAPVAITGLRWDDNGGFKTYSKYTVYTSSAELTRQVIEKTTDLAPYTQIQQTTGTYFYESPFHHQVTRQQVVNSDGTIENTYTKYVKDYNITTMNDEMVTALYHLQLQNQNMPVEHYIQVQKPNNDIKVTSASLIKFKAFNAGNQTEGNYALYLPAQKLSFVSQNGTTGFTPASVSSGNFVNDASYVLLENDLIYDDYGFLQTRDNNHKQVQTTLSRFNGHLPVVAVSNAAADEIACFNPNNQVSNAYFELTGGSSYTGRAGTGSSGINFTPDAHFSKTIKKNINAKNYIFSVWVSSFLTNTFSVTLTGTDNIPHVYPISFTENGVGWKYYEIKVPVTGLSSSFTVKLQNNASSAVAVTDLLFYPEQAEVTTSDYNAGTQSKIVSTNTNGISEYYDADNFGRLTLVYNQDREITARKSYRYADSYQTFSEPTFSFFPINNITTNTYLTFYENTNYNPCQFTGITYTWNFGDGTVLTSTAAGQTHKYSSAGTYTVTHTVNALGYDAKSTAVVITVTAPPVPPPPPPPALVIPVVYTNNSSGAISSIQLSQSGVVMYTFTADDLLNGNVMVPAASYRIRVFCTGSYGSVKLSDGALDYCSDHGPSNSYTFLANLLTPHSLTITLEDGPCN